MPRFMYEDDALVIRIPTCCAAATHHLLLKGMVASMKQSINAEANEFDKDGLIALTDLFTALLPTEVQLQKAAE